MIGLLIYHLLPDLAMLRSVFSTAEEPAAVAAEAGQQAAEQPCGNGWMGAKLSRPGPRRPMSG